MGPIENILKLLRFDAAPLSTEKWDLVERIMLAGLLLLIAHHMFILIWSLGEPLLERHAFRQTQTAISAYWMLQGGPLLIYETPVRGAPWIIPFEFPIFHWSAVLLAKLGIPLDDAGRIAAFLYLLGSAWPITMIARSLNFGRFGALALLALFFATPLLLFAGHAFLIETCAVFFCLVCLAFLFRAGETRKLRYLAIAAGAGALGGLAKSTTLPAFSLLGGFYFLYVAYGDLVVRRDTKKLFFLAMFSVALITPYIISYFWVAYTDSLKEQYQQSVQLTSEYLRRFTFGEFDARFGKQLWGQIIPRRTFPTILGHAAIIGVGFTFAALASRRMTIFVGFCLIAFITPMMIFTNLHVAHRYYQAANAIFLISAVALSLTALHDLGRKRISAALVGLIVMGQLAFYYDQDFKRIGNPLPIHANKRIIALEAKERLPEDSVLFYFDGAWSSEIPYYAERKSVALGVLRGDRLRDAFEKPETYTGDMTLGGIVVCGKVRNDIKKFLKEREVLIQRGPCQLLSATQNS